VRYYRFTQRKSTESSRYTVIDEADELLSSGWEEVMEKLFQGSGKSVSETLEAELKKNRYYR